MPDPIRKTDFTWDTAHESRAAVWNRIKRHVQHELDRIQADHTRRRQIARRMATPTHERNRQILHAFQQGVSVVELAHRHRLKAMRVREIVRTEARWHRLHVLADAGDGERADHPHGTSRQLDVLPGGSAPVMTVMTDP